MSKITKEGRELIEQVCLDAIYSDDKELNTPKEKLEYARMRFLSEYGWRIKQAGEMVALSDWLQGLALNIPCYNSQILSLAERLGQDVSTKRKQDTYIERYWKTYMPMNYLKLWKKYKIV